MIKRSLKSISDMFNSWRIFISPLLHLLLIFGNSLAKKNLKSGRNSTSREIGYFWHLSDVFFDPTYSPLGAPEDGHDKELDVQNLFYFPRRFTIFHKYFIQKNVDCHVKNTVNFTRNCGFFGELGQCSAFGLVETIARAMKSTRWKIAGPEFCIFTGNLRCPNPENQADAIYETMSAFITDIKNAGFANVYPSYGWYDYHPYGHHPLKLTTLYDELKNLLLEQKTNSSILGQLGQKTGYFSRVELPQNKIRVIVMNTNFYLKNHIASRLSDPAGQWKWLMNQLKGCRMAFQKAFIVMSIPPGVHGDWNERERTLRDDLVWSDRHNRQYIKIINEYHDVIAAQFAGHRHEDTFRLVYNREGKAISVILLAPAINPSFGNYPAMRIYMYDKNSGEILDFVQYYFNLTKANLEADMTSPEKYWEVSYSFRDFYLLSDATISSFEKLVKRFWKNDGLFQRYYRNVEGLRRRKYNCEDRCRLITFCEITTIDFGSFFECISGQFMARKRSIRKFQPPPEALRNRLIRRGKNPVSSSVAANVSPRDLILDIIYAVVLSRVINFFFFFK